MEGRWSYLNGLADKSRWKVAGFYNNEKLGVCGTNVILSMIMSSVVLMDILECKYKNCPATIIKNIEQLKYYEIETTGKLKEKEISSILIKGICDTYKNKTSNNSLGVAADYCISKSFTNNFKKLMKVFPAATESMIFEKTLLERSSLERFNTVLNDVISVEPLDVSGHLYRYIYYPKIRVLNVEFELENVQHDPIHITSFQSCYYNDIDHSIINNLNDEMVKRKIRPKVIQIAFHEKPIMRIHERTFFKFSQFLSRLKGEGILNAPPPDFSVFLQTQRFTMPRINEETIYFPFPTDIGEKNYELKAISFRIYQEFELLMSHIPPIIHESSTVKNCVEKFRAKTVSYLDSSEIKILIFLYAYMEKYIGYFNTICLTVLDNEKFYPILYKGDLSMHTFSIIQREHNWFMMNDQHSFKIYDIVAFSELLKNEVIDAVVLENLDIGQKE